MTEAARYIGVSPDLIVRGLNAGEIIAYEKPITRGRTGKRHNVLLKFSREDLDTWVRTYWVQHQPKLQGATNADI